MEKHEGYKSKCFQGHFHYATHYSESIDLICHCLIIKRWGLLRTFYFIYLSKYQWEISIIIIIILIVCLLLEFLNSQWKVSVSSDRHSGEYLSCCSRQWQNSHRHWNKISWNNIAYVSFLLKTNYLISGPGILVLIQKMLPVTAHWPREETTCPCSLLVPQCLGAPVGINLTCTRDACRVCLVPTDSYEHQTKFYRVRMDPGPLQAQPCSQWPSLP